MSRLKFAPPLKEIEVTEIERGLTIFKPKPNEPVSLGALKTALKKAGYILVSAEIIVAGKIVRDDVGVGLIVESSGQRFVLENADDLVADATTGVNGEWKTIGEREVIVLKSKKVAQNIETVDVMSGEWPSALTLPLAPIRTTSPGLTVYQGGAIAPRYINFAQQQGSLEITRHIVQLNLSYTPTPHLQLAAEIPYSRSEIRDGRRSITGEGFGNITLWGKYRFFRVVKPWGDRQASARVGLELPTGNKDAPTAQQLNASSFLRQQLTPINGGWSPHFDLAYAQAKGRLVFGGNVETILRRAREGFRLGHELHINTDLEYVIFPFKYRRPTGELFGILETTTVRRGLGRLNGQPVADSRATEFLLAPGLQYVASARWAIEASVQLPVVREVGRQTLRTKRNVLVGVSYLF